MNDQPTLQAADDGVVSLIKPVLQYRSAAEIQVRAYGQLCSVEKGGNFSLAFMQSSVQMQLGMKEQSILLHDAEGNQLSSDAELEQACEAGRLPLQALLADTAIHDMEMKRDEIAQMQWRLVREQFTSVNKAANSMAGQIAELKSMVNQQKNELKMVEERLRSETRGMLAKETTDWHDDMKNTCSRVDELSRAIHNEHNTLEVATLHQQKQLESAKLFLQGETKKLEMDVNRIRADLDVEKAGIRLELKSSEQVLDSKINDLKPLQGTCDGLEKLIQEETQSRQLLHQSILAKLAASTENLEKQLKNTELAQQTFKNDMSDRVSRFDENYTQFCTKMYEKCDTRSQEIEDAVKRFASITTQLEGFRLEHQSNVAATQQATDKANSMIDQIKKCEKHCDAMLEQEQQTRANQNRMLWNAISVYTLEAKSQTGRESLSLLHSTKSAETMPPSSASSRQVNTVEQRSHVSFVSPPAVNELVYERTLTPGRAHPASIADVKVAWQREETRRQSGEETPVSSLTDCDAVPANTSRHDSMNPPIGVAGMHGAYSVPTPPPRMATSKMALSSPVRPMVGTSVKGQPRQLSRSPSRERVSTYPTISPYGGTPQGSVVGAPVMSNRCFWR